MPCPISQSLAGVQEGLTAFDNHALHGYVFLDALCLLYFIVHYPIRTENVRDRLPPSLREKGMPGLWPDLGRRPGTQDSQVEPVVTNGERTFILNAHSAGHSMGMISHHPSDSPRRQVLEMEMEINS